jgi:bifunctional DNA-binding transcriptional regulator/antitoxin component of YhaV-PrlF toxin-antitoxin module
MSAVEISTLLDSGKIAIPNDIRSELNAVPGTRFAVISDGKNILLKPIGRPKIAAFNALISKSRKYARKIGLKKRDVAKAI